MNPKFAEAPDIHDDALDMILSRRVRELKKMHGMDRLAQQKLVDDLMGKTALCDRGQHKIVCPGCGELKYVGDKYTVCMSCREASKPKTMCEMCGLSKYIARRGHGICLQCRKSDAADA